jgi:transposase
MGPKIPRKKYSKEFKLEAVKLVKEQGMTYRKVAEDLGVAAVMLTRWARELSESGEYAFPGKGKLDARDEALRQLQEELRKTRMERDILKKAMAYFAKNPE